MKKHLPSILFWFVTVTTCISGFALLFKIPGMYRPDAYLVNGQPGTGTTDFEITATFVFGCVYLCPIFGLLYARFFEMDQYSTAVRAACIGPMSYHILSTIGTSPLVFGPYLNPEVTSIASAMAMHAVYAVLFAVLFWMHRDDRVHCDDGAYSEVTG